MKHFRPPSSPPSPREAIVLAFFVLLGIVALSLLAVGAALWLAQRAHADELQWRLDPDGRWVYVDPGYGQWRRAPTGPGWKWVQPDEDWRLDPKGRWQVVPR